MNQQSRQRLHPNSRIEIGHHGAADPAAERAEVRRNLMRALPRIDPRYFYDDVGSTLFERITRLPEYYQTRTEESLLAAIADDVVAAAGAVELVELGSGAGRKIRLLLDAMLRRGQLEGCTMLDINESFLRASVERLAERHPEIEVRGIVGDFVHDLGSIGGSTRPRLFVFLAGTIGNLEPRRHRLFLEQVRDCLGPDDAFLVGLDLVKDPRVLEAAYNDRDGVTAAFNSNILRVLNRRFGTRFEIDAFEHVAFYDRDREWIEMRLRAVRPTSAALEDGRELRFAAGDEIRTEISRKFTRESFTASLDGTGLELSRWYTDDRRRFASALLRPVRREDRP